MPTLSKLTQKFAIAQAKANEAAIVAAQAKEQAEKAAAKKDLTQNPNKKLRDAAQNTEKAADDAQAHAVQAANDAKHMADKVTVAQERASKVTATTVAAATAKCDELTATVARLNSHIKETYTNKGKKTPADLKAKAKDAKQALAIAKEEVEFQNDAFLSSVETKKKAANSKIVAEHAEFVTKLSAIAKGLNQGKSSLAKQEAEARQAINDAFNNSPVKVAHDLRKSDQIAKAATKPSSHGGAANKAALAALAKIKQPSRVNRVVTSILNAIKTVTRVVAKVIVAPIVLTDKAIVALGQDIAKVAKALNPITAYKKHQAKKSTVIKEAQDFEASFGQGLIDAMTVLADKTPEHAKMAAAVGKAMQADYKAANTVAKVENQRQARDSANIKSACKGEKVATFLTALTEANADHEQAKAQEKAEKEVLAAKLAKLEAKANAEAVAKVVARAYKTQQSIAAAKITPPSSPSGSQPIARKSPKAQVQAPDSDGPGTPGDLPKLMPASPTSSNVSGFDTTPLLSTVSSPR